MNITERPIFDVLSELRGYNKSEEFTYSEKYMFMQLLNPYRSEGIRDDLAERIQKEFKNKSENITPDNKELAVDYFRDTLDKTISQITQVYNKTTQSADPQTYEYRDSLSALVEVIDWLDSELHIAQEILPEEGGAITGEFGSYKEVIEENQYAKGCIMLVLNFPKNLDNLVPIYEKLTQALRTGDNKMASSIVQSEPDGKLQAAIATTTIF